MALEDAQLIERSGTTTDSEITCPALQPNSSRGFRSDCSATKTMHSQTLKPKKHHINENRGCLKMTIFMVEIFCFEPIFWGNYPILGVPIFVTAR